MRLFTGTSGYAYKEWRGSFYPDGLPEARMLDHYAARLPAVELNNTFYRMPKSAAIDGWTAAAPAGFRFALKASRRITHQAKLCDVDDSLDFLWRAVRRFGDHQGPVLFQLPPYLRKDVDRLSAFLARVPPDVRIAVEFRHASWLDHEVAARLRDAGAALCAVDEGPAADADLPTADWGYLRLRRADQDEDALARLAARIRARPWRECFAFFKHEDGGDAPRRAARLLELSAD